MQMREGQNNIRLNLKSRVSYFKVSAIKGMLIKI